MKNKRFCALRIAAAISFALTSLVHADVTTEQKTTLNVASAIRVHGTSTMSTTSDKQRDDNESHCEGMLSLLCGNQHSGEIIRLDRDLTWHLEPDKKRYREETFATPEQLREMRAKMQANLDKMKACPVSQSQAPIDKSKCEMSQPKIDVRKTEEKMSIAGHDAERTLVSLTQTCTNKETGDACDMVVALDVWLTQDKLPGSADRQAFQQAYAKKLGLDDMQAMIGGEAAKFLAPYQSQMKQLAGKSSDLKGQPLKSSFRMLFGGQQCSSAAKMKEQNPSTGAGSVGDAATAGKEAGVNSAQSSANNAAQQAVSQSAGSSVGGNIVGSAVNASVNKLIGGLFNKKTPPSPQAPTTTAASANKATDSFPQLVQMAEFTLETVSISTDPIPANHFDVPPDWKKELPKSTKNGNEEFTCPKTGT